ncbi:MAG: putative CRISPR-associated protein [Planctomycetes bacterium]|nr:putative CRISPR-associated protein [Planctomycetota bacterium]
MIDKKHNLICTVGVSMFYPNLTNLKNAYDKNEVDDDNQIRLVKAFIEKNWEKIGEIYSEFSEDARICGAEINSITDMIKRGYIEKDCTLYFCVSDTTDGNSIGRILTSYFNLHGNIVKVIRIRDLQDEDPKRFRTKGLRNLAKEICRIINDFSPQSCAINSTGGYKAQIALGVLLGQALEVPVYYKHERFPEIIAFPPMPIALDFEFWLKISGILFDLVKAADTGDMIKFADYEDVWNEKLETLVDRVVISGQEYIDISSTGVIFHETYKTKFQKRKEVYLPPAAKTKKTPKIEKSGWIGEHNEVEKFMLKITEQVDFVVYCNTFYYNPDLPKRMRFTLSPANEKGEAVEKIICIYSDGSYCVKFYVETSAKTDSERSAALTYLNQNLI